MRDAGYTPSFPDDQWQILRPFVTEVVARVSGQIRYSDAAVFHTVSHHVHWAHIVAGMPLQEDVVFRRDVVAYSVSMIPTLYTATMGRHRSLLLRVGEALGVIVRDKPLPRLPSADPSVPYTRDEIGDLRLWARFQRERSQRSAWALIALGLGAGLPTRDLARVRAVDVAEAGDRVRVIDGEQPRTITVCAAWVRDLRELRELADDRDASLFRPGVEFHKNIVHTFVQRSIASEVGPTTQRMRVTWLVEQLGTGTPMQDLLHGAGLKSMDALVRYQRFLPAPETVDVRGIPAGTASSPRRHQASARRP